MTFPPESRTEIDVREELDIVRIDPQFLERQRNKYASRGLALVVLLNGIAAIALLVSLAQHAPSATNVKLLADAMMVFGVGAALGLTSAFFAYLSRTFRLERPRLIAWRRPLRWFAVAAAIAGTACFVAGLNMARIYAVPDQGAKPSAINTPKPNEEPSAPKPGEPAP